MSDEQKPEGRNVGLSAGLDDTALKAAAAKLRKLRLTDVHGRKEAPCETVKSALKRGLGGLYDDEAVTYILRHGLKYYIAALSSNALLDDRPSRINRMACLITPRLDAQLIEW